MQTEVVPAQAGSPETRSLSRGKTNSSDNGIFWNLAFFHALLVLRSVVHRYKYVKDFNIHAKLACFLLFYTVIVLYTDTGTPTLSLRQ